jgi:hypothetical protein
MLFLYTSGTIENERVRRLQVRCGSWNVLCLDTHKKSVTIFLLDNKGLTGNHSLPAFKFAADNKVLTGNHTTLASGIQICCRPKARYPFVVYQRRDVLK